MELKNQKTNSARALGTHALAGNLRVSEPNRLSIGELKNLVQFIRLLDDLESRTKSPGLTEDALARLIATRRSC